MTATAFDSDAHRRRAPKRAPLRTAVSRSLGKWLAIGVVSVGLLGVGGYLATRILGHFQPFAQRTVDRTQPAILQAITDLHDYRAASASFDIVVDVEKDARWMPAALRGEHTVMSARGSVDAGVDLSALNATAVVVDSKTKAITVNLPHAQLRKPTLDLAATKTVVHQRGLLDRLGSAVGGAPNSERPMLQLAEKKLAAAARASDVSERAEENTQAMITSLVRGLGHDDITVTFVDTVQAPPPKTPTRIVSPGK